MPTTLTSKGQVTIPKAVRDYLGLRPGNSVSFEVDAEGRVVVARAGALKPARRPSSRFARIRGTATAAMTTDEIMELLRGDDPVLTGERPTGNKPAGDNTN